MGRREGARLDPTEKFGRLDAVFANAGFGAARGIARAVLYALSEPDGVDINEVLIRPSSQPT